MPSVVHLLPSAHWAGTEAVAETLDACARAHGWSSLLDAIVPRGEVASSHALPWTRWALRRRDADVVHAHLPWPDRLGPCALAAGARPMVVTFHLLPDAGRWPRDRLTRLPSPAMLRALGRRPRTRWVALSSSDRAVLEAMLGARVHVVRNAPPPPRPVREAVAWPVTACRLATVGRLEWQKGYPRMLEALAKPPARDLDWHWMIAGAGADREALEAQRDALGLRERVTFLGARAASEVLRDASWLVTPSLREGMPLAPLEALEAGVPVLASPIGPHREMFADAPEALLPDDVARWPDALARWIASPDARITLLRRETRVLGDAPRDRTWRAYERLYRSVWAPDGGVW